MLKQLVTHFKTCWLIKYSKKETKIADHTPTIHMEIINKKQHYRLLKLTIPSNCLKDPFKSVLLQSVEKLHGKQCQISHCLPPAAKTV